MIRSFNFFLLLLCIFSLPKVFAAEVRPIFDLPDLLSSIDKASTDTEKIAAVRSFLVSQSTEWEQTENCRLANTSTARRLSQEPWSKKIYFLKWDNTPQSPNAVAALKMFLEFEQRPSSQKTYEERAAMYARLDEIPLDPVPNCNAPVRPLDYSKITDEHNRIFILTRINLGVDIYEAYLRSYWTRRGRSEVFQKLISCQNDFKDTLGASLFCFTNLTQSLNPNFQNRALNFLQEAALLTILLDRNPLRPCLGKHMQLFITNIEGYDAGSIFSPIHNMQDAQALRMRFACRY